jgi:PAS domain S-box-containing protein
MSMNSDLPINVSEYVHDRESEDAEALVAVFDRNGNYLYASDNHLEAVGYAADELTQLNLAQLVIKSDHHAAWVLRTISVLYIHPLQFSSRLMAKSGVVVPVAGTLAHQQDERRERYFITCVRVQDSA